MQLALPGSAGCFSFLQEALGPSNQRVKISKLVRDQLQDFKWIASSLSSRPTHLAEVVPTPPTYFGTMDAAKEGMGGVWLPPPNQAPPLAIQQPKASRLQHPILWRARFPQKIQSQLVSLANPTGSITNSDLELSGAIAHDDILPQPYHQSLIFCLVLSQTTLQHSHGKQRAAHLPPDLRHTYSKLLPSIKGTTPTKMNYIIYPVASML